MHALVRRFIKTAIGFLFWGLAIGAWMVVRRELYATFPTAYEVSAHTHAILVGFVMLMILGVALWMFPRPGKTDTRYRVAFVEGAYWLLAVGTAVRVAGELTRPLLGAPAGPWIVVLASFAQVAGLGLFFFTMWSRIRPVGSQHREAAGERF